MQELITRLTEKAGISTEQAATALETIKDFVKEKFPMLAGAVDNMFGTSQGATATPVTPGTDRSVLDKISDLIPGDAGQKAEGLAKDALHEAESAIEAAKEKLSGLFTGE